MESGMNHPDPQQEDSHMHQASANDPSHHGPPTDENTKPSQPESDAADPSRSVPRRLWLGPSIEINDAGVLFILALRGPGTAESVATALGLKTSHVSLFLQHLETVGLATRKSLVNPSSVDPTIIYEAAYEGLRWLQDRELGRVIESER